MVHKFEWKKLGLLLSVRTTNPCSSKKPIYLHAGTAGITRNTLTAKKTTTKTNDKAILMLYWIAFNVDTKSYPVWYEHLILGDMSGAPNVNFRKISVRKTI